MKPSPEILHQVEWFLLVYGPNTVKDICSGTGISQPQVKTALKDLECDSMKFGGWSFPAGGYGTCRHRIPVMELHYLPEQAARRPVLCRKVA